MDRFLSSHRLPQNEWALQLLSVACLSLPAKMDEAFLPSLLDLQVEGAKFIFEPSSNSQNGASCADCIKLEASICDSFHFH